MYWSSSQSKCIACTGGTYCAGYCVDACNPCPPNTAPDANKTTCVSGTCVLCPIGFFCGGGPSQEGCPAGTYGDKVGSSIIEDCKSCATGTYSGVASMTACVNCSAGSFAASVKQTACVLCYMGSYQSKQAADTCDLCGKGTYSNEAGLVSGCQLCAAGKYGPNVGMYDEAIACRLCGQGTFGAGMGLTDVLNCTACGIGTYSPAYGAASAGACLNCSQGYYGPNIGSAGCVACLKGTYQDKLGATSAETCASCPSFSDTVGDGATGIQDCACLPGYEGERGSISGCSACAAGSYAELAGQRKCTLCDPNTYDNGDGYLARDSAINCQGVPENSFSAAGATMFTCNGGYANFVNVQCNKCEQGSYSAQGGSCIPCWFGTTSAGVIATSIADCTCNPGYFKNGSMAACQACPLGFVCIGGLVQPTACALGKNTLVGGAKDASSCICQPGWFGAAGGDPCAVCTAGSYCPVGSVTAVACPLNTDSPSASSSIMQCACKAGYKPAGQGQQQGTTGTNCTICDVSSFCLSGNESKCRNNSVAQLTGQWSEAGCACNPGFWSDSNISTCNVCPSNYYCPGGQIKRNCPASAGTNGAEKSREKNEEQYRRGQACRDGDSETRHRRWS